VKSPALESAKILSVSSNTFGKDADVLEVPISNSALALRQLLDNILSLILRAQAFYPKCLKSDALRAKHTFAVL